MASASPGKRIWKCPECGREVELSVTQLDPIACDACMPKLRGGRTSTTAGLGDVVTSPLGIWQGLPESMKLAMVIGALVVGFLVGYMVGSSVGTTPKSSQATARSAQPAPESRTPSKTITEPAEDEAKSGELETRPDPPGPGYHWVQGRKKKDGTRGEGHWAKNPNYKGKDAATSK